MVVEALRSNESAICVPFNPWHFEDERQLIRGEALALQWGDLDFEARELRVAQTQARAG